MAKAIDITGQKFGKLTVVKRVENDKHGKTRWLCECECGNKKEIGGSDLRQGKSKTCGCSNRTHGLSDTHIYSVFKGMNDRCYVKDSPSYKWYGAEGIKICDEWLEDFEKFYEWSLNNGYAPNLTIDRIDNLKDYTPGNCRWVTRDEQAQNQRLSSRNTSGVRGVKWNKARRKWEVNISSSGKRHYLGLYTSLDEATKVRKDAEKKYWNV